MPVAEIIAIGTELLLGEIQDTNTHFLARSLRDAGIDLYRTTVVGDNAERIAQAIQEAMRRAQIIITTGGLGPTVDDPTRQAVALAVGTPLEFQPVLWDQIQARFQRYSRQATDNNRRQAFIPAGSIPVENPVGTAPAFIFETSDHAIISLPGVPREMEYLYENRVLPYLRQRFELRGVIKARVLHSAGVGESQIDAEIGDLETSPNPTVGLLAHAGRVDIRVTAKATSQEEADRLIEQMERVIRARLKDAIFGVDEQTLESAITAAIQARGKRLGLVECGLNGELALRLKPAGISDGQSISIPGGCDPEQMQQEVRRLLQSGDDLVLGAVLQPGQDRQTLLLRIISPSGEREILRTYGGPPAMGPSWAVNTALDALRRAMVEE